MEEFPYGRAEATEADGDYVTRLLGEQLFCQQINAAERDRRLQLVVAAQYVDQVDKMLHGLDRLEFEQKFGEYLWRRA